MPKIRIQCNDLHYPQKGGCRKIHYYDPETREYSEEDKGTGDI